jgi:hypothetical protein
VCDWCGQSFKLVTVGTGVKTKYILLEGLLDPATGRLDQGEVHNPAVCKRQREARAAELEKEADASRPGDDLK